LNSGGRAVFFSAMSTHTSTRYAAPIIVVRSSRNRSMFIVTEVRPILLKYAAIVISSSSRAGEK